MSAVPPAAGPGAADVVPADAGAALTYPELHRAGAHQWWRAVLGVLVVGGVGFVILPMVLLVAFQAVLAALGRDPGSMAQQVTDSVNGHLTPLALLFTLLSLWLMIPTVRLVQRLVHRLPGRTLDSVLFRLRWGWLGRCLGLAAVALAATWLVGALVPSDLLAGGDSLDAGGVNPMTATAWWFGLVVLLGVPLQAAGEEYVFRGYLLQAWGGVFGSRRTSQVVAVLGSGLVFALMHGTQEPPVFFDRFAFGVCAGVLVLLTGGLEAAIALHVVNNLVAFGTAIAFGDIHQALTPSGSTWWQVPISLFQVGFFGLLVWRAARRGGVARTSGAVPTSRLERST